MHIAQFSFNKCPIYTDGGASAKCADNNESAKNTLTLTHLCKKKITFQTSYVAPNCWMVQGVHFTDNIHIRYLLFIPAYNRIYSTNNREVITEQQQQHVLHKTIIPNCTKSLTN